MNVERCTTEHTHINQAALLEHLKAGYGRVIFFATHSSGGSTSDGPDSNWPLFEALVEPFPGNGYKVYDGFCLTAGRHHRYAEVKAVLDAAELSDEVEVSFGIRPVAFTSHLSPNGAATELLSQEVKVFNSETRAEFFKLLSPAMTEKLFAEQYSDK